MLMIYKPYSKTAVGNERDIRQGQTY